VSHLKTHTQSNLTCISAGQLVPKKSDHPIARLHQYLNYGLLSLATQLETSGLNPVVIHGLFEGPAEFVSRLAASNLLHYQNPILISVPSSFAIPWARQATRYIRELFPDATILVGGRWVVADGGQWIRGQLPDATLFVSGLAEDKIVRIVEEASSTPLQKGFGMVRMDPKPSLNYRLLLNWQEFQPSIEVSRGCGMHCSFCAEGEEPLGPLAQTSQVVTDFGYLSNLYRTNDVHPYLEASFFRPTMSWSKDLAYALQRSESTIQWRTETRVDSMVPGVVKELAKCGLKVLDLGLESASHKQLLSMRKTTKPSVYLRRASELLDACAEANVWAKVNILLHPGETIDSINETTAWLQAHLSAIKGVSVGSTILYRFGEETAKLLREYESIGASEVQPGSLDREGFSRLHLSQEITHEVAEQMSLEISRNVMSSADYFDLKSFSYFPRSLSYERFKEILAQNPSSDYSFSID
jgi:hypothetical protein